MKGRLAAMEAPVAASLGISRRKRSGGLSCVVSDSTSPRTNLQKGESSSRLV